MAKTVKISEQPVINNLVGANIYGVSEDGTDAQFPMDQIIRSDRKYITAASSPDLIDRFTGESYPVEFSAYGSTFPNFGGVSIPAATETTIISDAKIVWNAGVWQAKFSSRQAPPFPGTYTVRPFVFNQKAPFTSNELEVLKMVKDIKISYADITHAGDIFELYVFTVNGPTPNFENAIGFRNIATNQNVIRNLTSAEITAGYAEISITSFTGFLGQVVKVWFDRSLSTATGALITSGSPVHNVQVLPSSDGSVLGKINAANASASSASALANTANTTAVNALTLATTANSKAIEAKSLADTNTLNITDLSTSVYGSAITPFDWLKNRGSSFTANEQAVIDMIINIEIKATLSDHESDVFSIYAFIKNGSTAGFEWAMGVKNETTNQYVIRNTTEAERTAGVVFLNINSITGFSGQSAKITFDYSRSSATGNLVTSGGAHNILINITKAAAATSTFNKKTWVNQPIGKYSDNERKIGEAIIDIHFPPCNYDHLNDSILVDTFYKNDLTNGYLFVLKNVTTNQTVTVTPISAEVTAKKWVREMTFTGFEGLFVTFMVDYSLLADGVSLVSGRLNPNLFIEIKQPIQNPLYGKKIVGACNTSIWENWVPNVGADIARSFPIMAARLVGARMFNNSKSGLQIHLKSDGTIESPNGSSCATIAEYASPTTNPNNVSISSGQIRFRTYENGVLGQNADLYIFDQVPNSDNFSTSEYDKFNFTTRTFSDGSSFADNRKTYLGALLYIINALYTENPKARIAFTTTFLPDNIGVIQTKSLAEKLHLPFINLREKLGDNSWTYSQYMLVDGLHPTPDWGVYEYANILAGELLRLS